MASFSLAVVFHCHGAVCCQLAFSTAQRHEPLTRHASCAFRRRSCLSCDEDPGTGIRLHIAAPAWLYRPVAQAAQIWASLAGLLGY